MYCLQYICCIVKQDWWQLLIAFFLSFCAILYAYPKVLVKLVQRWFIYRAGFIVYALQVSPDCVFEYMEKGKLQNSSTTLLMLHGFTQTKDALCLVGFHIPSHYHVVVLDLPGHGGTSETDKSDTHVKGMVEKLHKFTAAAGLQERGFHLLGHSFGGLLAGLYAVSYADHINSLILVACAGIKSPNLSPLEVEYQKPEAENIMVIPETVEEHELMMRALTYKPRPMPRIIMRGVMQIRLEHHDFYLKAMESFKKDNARHMLTALLPHIKAHTLIVWGQNDKMMDVSCAEVIRKAIPSSRVAILDQCGHLVPYERPKALTSVVLNFIGQ